MFRYIFAFSTLALALAAGAGQPIKIVLVRDSTVNDEGGWGDLNHIFTSSKP